MLIKQNNTCMIKFKNCYKMHLHSKNVTAFWYMASTTLVQLIHLYLQILLCVISFLLVDIQLFYFLLFFCFFWLGVGVLVEVFSEFSEKSHLSIISHNIIQSCQQPQTSSYLRMHGSIDIVQEIQCLTDQVVPVFQQTLLYLCLTTCEEMISIRCLE